jgi:hypothetical protein
MFGVDGHMIIPADDSIALLDAADELAIKNWLVL